MRAITAVTATAIAGGALAIAYAAIEITAAAVGSPVPGAIRTLAVTVIALVILGAVGLAILCRQRSILDQLALIREFMLTSDQAQAVRDYNDIRRQLGGDEGGASIHRIHPQE